MTNTPIETVIRNLCDVDKTIQWTGGGSIWIGKNASVTVPYDVWTAADRKQRESLMAACQQKSVCLTLRVMQADGSIVELDYDPSVLMKPRAVVTPQPIKTAQFVESMQQDDKMHTVNATSATGASAAAHYGATKTAEDVGVGAHAEGANMNGFQKDTDTDVTGTKQALEQQESDDQNTDEQTNDDTQEAGTGDEQQAGAVSIPVIREEFNKLTANKQWEAALNLLLDVFGPDKVTFTTRTLMSMKDFDAVVEKYNLL